MINYLLAKDVYSKCNLKTILIDAKKKKEKRFWLSNKRRKKSKFILGDVHWWNIWEADDML